MTGLHSDLLSGQSVLQLINDNGKSDRRRLLSKLFQKMVITSACHNGITGSVSIGPKYNPGIVSIMTAHTQIKGHIIISPIQCKQFINLQKPPESEERNYQARLDEPYLEYEKVALEYDSNGASELLSLVNAMTCENACVYMELGVQAGILLIADIVQNLRREEIENIHYRNKCELLIEDIRQVLEIMKDSMTDECKQNMTNILNKWGAERKGEE